MQFKFLSANIKYVKTAVNYIKPHFSILVLIFDHLDQTECFPLQSLNFNKCFTPVKYVAFV